MSRLHGGDLTLARTEFRWEHHSQVADQINHVMTVGVDTVFPLNNVQDALMEGIFLACEFHLIRRSTYS